MKTQLLLISLFFGILNPISAQTLEHFKVRVNDEGIPSCVLVPNFDTLSFSEINGRVEDPEKTIYKMVKGIVHTFPEAVQEILKQQEVWVDLYFNAKGEIFKIYIYIRKTADPTFLTDVQWLEIYRTIQAQKLDMSKLKLSENFKWSAYGPFPISRYLREAKQKK